MKKLLLLTAALLTMLLSSCGSNGGNDEWYDLGLIPIRQGNQFGYINWEGQYSIMPQFRGASLFSKNGLALVLNNNGLYGYIDQKGAYAIPATYTVAADFNEGIAFVALSGGHLQAIDEKGNTLFTCETAKSIGNFSDGLAVYENWEGKYGAIDKKGQEVIPATFTYIGTFKDGLAPFKDESGKYGYLDKKGLYAINPQFDGVSDFREGIATVEIGEKYGFIDRKGTIVITPQFDYAEPFSEGVAMVVQGDAFGYIDKKGSYVINPQFQPAFSFQNGVAIAASKGSDLYGVIDKKGSYVINPQFKEIGCIYKGKLAIFNGSYWGFVDKKGKYLVNPQFEGLRFPVKLYSNDPSMLHSQYYDTTELLEGLTALVGNDPHSVDGFNQSITLGNLQKEKREFPLIYGEDKAISELKNLTLAEGITLYNSKITFDEEIVKIRSFWYGTTYNNDAKVRQVSMELHISPEKMQYLATIERTISNHLSNQYKLVPMGEKMEGVKEVAFRTHTDDNKLTIIFTFPTTELEVEESNESAEQAEKAIEKKDKEPTGKVAKAEKVPTQQTSTTKDKPKAVASERAWRTATIHSYDGYSVIRSNPDYDAEILNTIDSGTTVEAMVVSGEWCKIKWKGQIVYIPKNNLRF
ncbi:WG repeat-containing protein [uncultured Porphyromonas sp.]|uniref:WG repeat-containing protein n=1 Tax=uncultured Porphyromonas sp. TaxID=159274 RepID=UPI00259B78AF|nr:WG repeat-containing protein [uncultured Porphyromonas sp.]